MPARLLDYHEDDEGRFVALLEHTGTVSYYLYAPGLSIDARAFTPKALRLELHAHIKTPEQVDGLWERVELGQADAVHLLENHQRARAALRLLELLDAKHHS